MKPNQSFDVQLVNGNGDIVRLGNVAVELHLFTHGNFRDAFKVGRTDETGHMIISYQDVEAIRRENANFDLMDYNTRLDDCDPQVKIVIPSEQQLRKQVENAMRFYQAPPPWAKNWPSNAQLRSQEKSVEVVDQVTRVEILADRMAPASS